MIFIFYRVDENVMIAAVSTVTIIVERNLSM